MATIKEFRIFIRCAVAQLRNGNESLAHGPVNSAVVLRVEAPAITNLAIYYLATDTAGR